jgi:hypothetical protein
MTKGDFFRYCRLVHGWLSALAFLLLGFFALTGLLLNHPDWTLGDAPEPVETKFQLTREETDEIRDAQIPGQKLAELAAKRAPVLGAYGSGDMVGRELFVRLRGVRGQSDVRAHLGSGNVTVIAEGAPPLAVLNELHRGEHAGGSWKLLIDVTAIAVVVLSIIGFLIFLSMQRSRIRTAFALTALSAVGIAAVFFLTIA